MDDGMNPPHLNRQIVSKLVDVLGDYDPYYMQLAYTEIKLKGKVAQGNKLDELEKRLSKVESNHLHTLQEDIERLYGMSKEFAEAKRELVEIKKWIATQKSLKIQPQS